MILIDFTARARYLADLEVGQAARWQELDLLDREADDAAFAVISSTP